MITALIIPPQVSKPLTVISLDEHDLLSYRQIIGGDLEAVAWTQPGAHMYVDEHGKTDRLPANLRASVLWWVHNPAMLGRDTIAGPALVVGPPTADGDDTDVPREIVDLLLHTDAYRIVSRAPGDTRWRATSTTYEDWLDAYTVAVHTARRLGPEGTVRVVADTDISSHEPQR